MIPVILDIEASGFGKESYPIEIGFVLSDQTAYCHIIRPVAHWTFWDESAESLHGVSREILLQSGKSVEDIAQWLNDSLVGKTVYSDAWSHDVTWLGKLFDEAGIPLLFQLETLRKLLTEEQAALWHQIKSQIIQDQCLERHRASVDAAILQKTFLRTRSLTEQAS